VASAAAALGVWRSDRLAVRAPRDGSGHVDGTIP
jgi:hypothetical protein